jgi:phenylalanyl-tRNA synthetase beta chain
VPVIRFDAADLRRLMGADVSTQRLAERLPLLGADLDKVDGDEITIEFFPNRPDLLSVEGVARACRGFFDIAPGLPSYEVQETDEEVLIEPSVARVRPHIAFARVDGLRLDAERLKDLIDLQERLTTGLGRRRKKVAVGLHDARDVAAPYHYRAVGRDEVRFTPLGHADEMTPGEILERHEKGRLFAHLVEGHKKVPMILDRDGHVLSFPPIINGTRTQLRESTTDVLVDVTGPDKDAVYGTLNIVVTALAERGGTIHSLVHRKGKRTWRAPDLSPRRWRLKRKDVERLLGVPMPTDELVRVLGRMGHHVEATSRSTVAVDVGAWRIDMLHPVDLVEEAAIGYGYDRFESRLPGLALFGSQRAASLTAARARTLLLGHGFTEVVTLTLTNQRDAFASRGIDEPTAVLVANPVTQEQTMLRPEILPSLLSLLRANKHNSLPQAVFEVGIAVPPEGDHPHNQLRAAAVRIASRATFSEAKSLAEAFLRDAGISAQTKAGTVPGLVEGRSAVLESEDRSVGFFGEVAPATLDRFELEAPAYAFEVILDARPATP